MPMDAKTKKYTLIGGIAVGAVATAVIVGGCFGVLPLQWSYGMSSWIGAPTQKDVQDKYDKEVAAIKKELNKDADKEKRDKKLAELEKKTFEDTDWKAKFDSLKKGKAEETAA